MELIVYLLPFIIAVILLLFFRKYIVWWEYILLICSSLFFSFIIKEIMICSLESDTEYLGGYMTKITHYDEWDEWIERTCTKTVHDGYDKDGNEITHEETYDCSYRDYHPERWTYTDNKGREEYFYNRAEFERAMSELGNPSMVFRDMHRDYYKIDGDAQDYFYDGSVQHVRPLVWRNSYKNKIIASKSIFKFRDISSEEAKELGLFDYPRIIDDDQDVILGIKLKKDVHKEFKYINSIYGGKHQFRIYVLVFVDKPLEISEEQKSYWQGGNKNEFVLCLGYNSKKKTIEWCNPFSWCDKPTLEVATKRYFNEHKRIYHLKDYSTWLKNNISLWKRKEFKDFEYIDNTITKGQGIALIIITLIGNIVLSIFLIGNEFSNDDYDDDSYFCAMKDIQRSITSSISKKIKNTYNYVSDKGCKVLSLCKDYISRHKC